MPTSQQAMQVLSPALEVNNVMTAVKMLWGPSALGTVIPALGALSGQGMSNSTASVAWQCCLPKDGTITDVGFYISAKNGTPPSYNVGIVTLDSSGNPTTTAYGGSAITGYTPTSTGWKWVTLSTPATAVAGDFCAPIIYPGASAPDGSNNITVTNTPVVNAWGATLYYGGLWFTYVGLPPMAVRYNDGSVHGLALSSNTVHLVIAQNTTPDEVGCVFQVPVAMTVYGMRFSAYTSGWGYIATADVVLYDSGDNVIATSTISDKDAVKNSSTIDVLFDAVTIAPARNYRIVVKPTTDSGGDIYMQKWAFDSTDALAALPCGDTWRYTSRTDAGSWSDDSSAICPMALWVSGIEFTSAYAQSG